MPRTVVEVPYKKGEVTRVDQALINYLAQEKFQYFDNGGETVYVKGSSLWSGMQMFKFEYSETTVRVSAWISYRFFGLRSQDSPLTGFIGAWTKGRAKYRMDRLLEIIEAVK
ncbi:MAG: hypothetical protein K6B12_00530 [Clostridiales bacterium]|nr:hypothetical protein [Clostridiales bacterium]